MCNFHAFECCYKCDCKYENCECEKNDKTNKTYKTYNNIPINKTYNDVPQNYNFADDPQYLILIRIINFSFLEENLNFFKINNIRLPEKKTWCKLKRFENVYNQYDFFLNFVKDKDITQGNQEQIIYENLAKYDYLHSYEYAFIYKHQYIFYSKTDKKTLEGTNIIDILTLLYIVKVLSIGFSDPKNGYYRDINFNKKPYKDEINKYLK